MYTDDFLADLIQHLDFNWVDGFFQFGPTALPASVFNDTTTPRIPQGLWNHPRAPYLYAGVPLANKLAVYRYDYLGNLYFVRAVANQGGAICWLRTNSNGTRLYSTDTLTNSVGVYDITQPDKPVQLQEFALSGPGNAFQLALSPDDKNLYVLSPRTGTGTPVGQGNILHTLAIAADGTLAEIAQPIPFPSADNARPRGVLDVSVR